MNPWVVGETVEVVVVKPDAPSREGQIIDVSATTVRIRLSVDEIYAFNAKTGRLRGAAFREFTPLILRMPRSVVADNRAIPDDTPCTILYEITREIVPGRVLRTTRSSIQVLAGRSRRLTFRRSNRRIWDRGGKMPPMILQIPAPR